MLVRHSCFLWLSLEFVPRRFPLDRIDLSRNLLPRLPSTLEVGRILRVLPDLREPDPPEPRQNSRSRFRVGVPICCVHEATCTGCHPRAPAFLVGLDTFRQETKSLQKL